MLELTDRVDSKVNSSFITVSRRSLNRFLMLSVKNNVLISDAKPGFCSFLSTCFTILTKFTHRHRMFAHILCLTRPLYLVLSFG
jgi:hypothetical protein